MKPKIIFTIVALLIVAGLFVWGYTQNAGSASREQDPSVLKQLSSPSVGQLTASSTRHDFGSISMKDGNVTTDFLINNSGKSDITVGNIVTSCMCTTAFLIGKDGEAKGPFGMLGHSSTPIREVIAVGESRLVRVVYDPNAHGPAGLGAIDRSITLTDNNGQELQLTIKAIVTP